MGHVDFWPTTSALAALVRGVHDERLAGPTPCPAFSVAGLLDHIGGLAAAFAWAARQDGPPEGGSPSADGSRLDGFRDRIASALDGLGGAWQDPAAYDGTTVAGPVALPADHQAALVARVALAALDEVTVHAWDLAVATGRPYPADPAAVEACRGFVASAEPPPGGTADDGALFGPPVAVAADAPAVDQLIGATGRDPAWTP